MHALLGTSVRYDEASGHWVSAEFQRIAQVIHDFDPDLSLAWIPPEMRQANEVQAFAIICAPVGREQYIVRLLGEEELNENLIAWLFTHNSNNVNVLDAVEAKDAARKALEMQRELDEREEMLDIAKSMLKSPLHTYRHNGKKLSL